MCETAPKLKEPTEFKWLFIVFGFNRRGDFQCFALFSLLCRKTETLFYIYIYACMYTL